MTKPTPAQIFIDGIAAMSKASDRGLTEFDVRTPDHRKYLFNFHEQTIEQARKVKAALTAAAEVGQNDFVLCYKGVPDAWRVKPEDLK